MLRRNNRDDTERLRRIVRHALAVWVTQAMARGEITPLFKDARYLAADPEVFIRGIYAVAAAADRETLLDLAERARREKIKLPRKEQIIDDVAGSQFLGVCRRINQGVSDRRACDAEAISLGYDGRENLDRFRKQYQRTRERMRSIFATLGFDLDDFMKRV